MVHPRQLNWLAPRQSLREVLSDSERSQPWRMYRLPGLLPAVLLRVASVSILTKLAAMLCLPSEDSPFVPSDPTQDEYQGPSFESTRTSVFGMVAYLSIYLLIQLIAVPLECMVVRLATQRPVDQQPLHMAFAENAPPDTPSEARPPAADTLSEGSDAEGEEEDLPMLVPAASEAPPSASHTLEPTDEPVIALRPCDEQLDEVASYYGTAAAEPYTGLADCFRKMVVEEGYESLYRGLPFSLGIALVAGISWLPLGMDRYS